MKLYHVDAFTDTPFKGNSAGVLVYSGADVPDSFKQDLAAELRHSETAFVWRRDDGTVCLRWFTPKREVSLCGHATLASARILFETGLVEKDSVVEFQTASGILSASMAGDRIELDFPQIRMTECEPDETVNRALGIKPLHTLKNEKRYLLEIEDPKTLRTLEPDFDLLATAGLGAFIVTSRSDREGYDFLSRFFAPYVGIPEDPVTGSAHCSLAPYWAGKLGKTRLMAFQESKRTGTMECELMAPDRVKLSGQAVTLYEAEIRIDDR